ELGAGLDRDREGLGRDPLAVLGEGAADVPVVLREGDPDPVGDLEAGVLAHLLDRADHVADDALEAKLRRDLGVERHGEAVAVCDREALPGARPQLVLARLEHPVADPHAAVCELELALAQEAADDRQLAPVLGPSSLSSGITSTWANSSADVV